MASIVVSGDVLRRPRGSNLAAHLQYLIGLRKLGHEVTYLEERGLPHEDVGDGHVVPREGIVLLGDLLRRCRVDIPLVWVDARRRPGRGDDLAAAAAAPARGRPAARHRRALLPRGARAAAPPCPGRHRAAPGPARRSGPRHGRPTTTSTSRTAAIPTSCGAAEWLPDDPTGRAASLVRAAGAGRAAAQGARRTRHSGGRPRLRPGRRARPSSSCWRCPRG